MEVLTTNQTDRDAKVAAAIADLTARKFHIVSVDDYDMPSNSDGTVKVTHICYRKVDII